MDPCADQGFVNSAVRLAGAMAVTGNSFSGLGFIGQSGLHGASGDHPHRRAW